MLEPRDVQRYERELRAMVRRAGDEDPEGFAQIAKAILAAGEAMSYAAGLMRAQHGYSWRELANAMDKPSSSVHAALQVPKSLEGDVAALKTAITHTITIERTDHV